MINNPNFRNIITLTQKDLLQILEEKHPTYILVYNKPFDQNKTTIFYDMVVTEERSNSFWRTTYAVEDSKDFITWRQEDTDFFQVYPHQTVITTYERSPQK